MINAIRIIKSGTYNGQNDTEGIYNTDGKDTIFPN